MRKMIALPLAAMCLCTAAILPAATMQARSNNAELTGAGDGHCTKCGLHNGHYRCPVFCPASGARPTTCSCGHGKSSHAYKR